MLSCAASAEGIVRRPDCQDLAEDTVKCVDCTNCPLRGESWEVSKDDVPEYVVEVAPVPVGTPAVKCISFIAISESCAAFWGSL